MRVETQGQWEFAGLSVFPGPWRENIRRRHAEKVAGSLRAGNRWLLDLSDAAKALRVPIDLTDAELRDMAADCARRAMSLTDGAFGLVTLKQYRAKLETFVKGYGIEPPEPARINRNGERVGCEDAPAVRRMTDEHWWRRALRRAQARDLEGWAIQLGYVHRRAQVYASDVTVERRAEQRRRNAATLEETEAVNVDTGEVFSLADLASRAVSNPVIRRGELMLRIRGFEEVAQGVGHAAEFWTATCPSRMHAKKVSRGETADNPKYDGTTPREAQRYLSKTWANFRAAAARRGLRFYGFRIAEPHHDATPHWHLLLFMPAMLDAARSAVGRLRALFRRYFLRADGDEFGAKRNRCEFVSIDWKRGSAAGYVAKYVSKNIDGFAVQQDLEAGCDAVQGSQRVEAWASTWGIRQFQQVGGPPVGVWRELRRMRETSPDCAPEVEAQRAAADAGNWRRYVELQGGPVVRRVDLPLRVAYTRPGERWCESVGAAVPAPANRYGEEAARAVFGVRDVRRDRAHVSRLHRWEVRRFSGRPSAARAAWTCVNNCSREGVGHDEKRGEERGGEAALGGRELQAAGNAAGAGCRTGFFRENLPPARIRDG